MITTEPKTHSSIFFHMGPGFHAQIEREIFGSDYPHVLFVDQPYFTSFNDLTKWAENLIVTQYNIKKTPLVLIGHSFGSQIIAAVMPNVSKYVKEVRMLNSVFNSFDAFIALNNYLKANSSTQYDNIHSLNNDNKIEFIMSLAAHPNFSDSYWVNKEVQQTYANLAKNKPNLNINTFVSIFKSYLNEKRKSFPWDGKATLYYSTSDALNPGFSFFEEWGKLYPNINFVELTDSGHHSHFELRKFADLLFQE